MSVKAYIAQMWNGLNNPSGKFNIAIRADARTINGNLILSEEEANELIHQLKTLLQDMDRVKRLNSPSSQKKCTLPAMGCGLFAKCKTCPCRCQATIKSSR